MLSPLWQEGLLRRAGPRYRPQISQVMLHLRLVATHVPQPHSVDSVVIAHITNMITISAMALLMLLPLSSSVSTAGEALNLKLDYSLTNEQSM